MSKTENESTTPETAATGRKPPRFRRSRSRNSKPAPPRPTRTGTACSAPPPISTISRNAPPAKKSRPRNTPILSLLQKLLPVLDNFEMALAAAQNAQGDKLASLQSGVAMIQQQLKTALAETGLEEIDAAGKPFDPDVSRGRFPAGIRRCRPKATSCSSFARATNSRNACCARPPSSSPKNRRTIQNEKLKAPVRNRLSFRIFNF